MIVKKLFLLVLLFDGLIWLRSSYGKFAAGNFVAGLPGTLGKFASNNPYPWFKNFLQNVAIPNVFIIGNIVLWGELFVALTVALGSGYLLLQKNNPLVKKLLMKGLLVGAFFNFLFWLAAGWTSPSTDGLNLLMVVLQVVGVIYVWKM